MLRLAAVTALFAVVFLAQGSVLNGVGGLHPSPFASVEAEATEEATVRISAKRLENGRTEFGLQIRSDGAWGPVERLLPRSRMFPANARVGRWLRSTPLELDSGHVVRITAQLLENGRIEFGLHEVIDGELGERLLPRSRMFPTNPTVDRWLNSSSLVLSVRNQGDVPMDDETGETDTAEPVWTPITEAQSGTTEAGAYYQIDYPERYDGERRSYIHVDADEAPAQFRGQIQGQPVRFRIWCHRGERIYQVEYHPTTDGEYPVRSRIDGGEWTESTWQIRTTDRGFTYAAPQLDYEALRMGTTLEIELEIKIPGSIVLPRTFDLETLFGTPVQANIENCGVPVWPEPQATYVPVVNVDGSTSDALFWNARLVGDDVLSSVSILASVAASPLGFLQLTNSCLGGERFLNIDELERTDAEFLNVRLELDGVSLSTEAWAVEPARHLDGTKVSSAAAPNVERLAAQLRNASSLTVTIDGSGLPPVTFDLTGMFDTPVQANIDNCGNYKPGETRE